ncbi:sensor histidine kinase [Egbenema bharatensis]|uniref:sensor histidine kinase n=1 Tax=Egbenema bharatensis TaxID=3463334 RepID=UPI003A8887D9
MNAQSANQPDRYLMILRDIEHRLFGCTKVSDCCNAVLERLGQATQIIYSCVFAVPSPLVQSDQVENVPASKDDSNDSTPGDICWLAEWYGEPSQDTTNFQGMSTSVELATWRDEMTTSWHHFTQPESEDDLAFQMVEASLRSMSSGILLFPLWVNHQVYGVLGIKQSEGKEAIPAPELALFQGTAAALSLKLDALQAHAATNALTQQIQQLHHQLETATQQHTLQSRQTLNFEALLRRITDRVRDSLDENQILQTAVQELAIVLETHSCDTGLYNLEQGTSTIVYEYICTTEISSAKGTVLQFSDYIEVYSHLLNGQNVQFCWASSPSSWDSPPETTSRNIQERVAILCCPLIDDQGVIGDIWLYKIADHGFDAESVRLVEQVANQCAIAIRQARLYEAAQAQVRELEHLNYLKDDFLNTVSHELRSPMANIEMSIQMLQLLLFNGPITESIDEFKPSLPDDSAPFPARSHVNIPRSRQRNCSDCDSFSLSLRSDSVQQVVRYFRMLQDECSKEINLINDLLDLSRLEAGTEPLMLTTIDLSTWIPHVVEPFLERARTQVQHLNVEVAPDLPPITTDLSSLERVLSELLHNACKYTPPNATITVSAHCISPASADPTHCDRPSLLILQVSNSGTELLPSELPRIFDKFYRIPSNDPWKHGGTGLGLALVKRLVGHLGATIRVDSSNNQVTFTIEFPL